MTIGKLVERTRQTCVKVLRRLSRLPKSVRGRRRSNRVLPSACDSAASTSSGGFRAAFAAARDLDRDRSVPFEEQLLRLERRQVENSVLRYMSAISSPCSASLLLDLVNPAFEWGGSGGGAHVCSTPLSTRAARSEGLDNSLNEALERTGGSDV